MIQPFIPVINILKMVELMQGEAPPPRPLVLTKREYERLKGDLPDPLPPNIVVR